MIIQNGVDVTEFIMGEAKNNGKACKGEAI